MGCIECWSPPRFKSCFLLLVYVNDLSTGLYNQILGLLPMTLLFFRLFVIEIDRNEDIIFDQVHNKLFHDNLELIQYNGSSAITCAIRGASKERLYRELDPESLQHRCCFHKLCTFYKIYKSQSLCYLYKLLPFKPACRSQDHLTMFPVFFLNTAF